MKESQEDFEEFMKERIEVAKAYVHGDAVPLGRIVAEELPATFFGPAGGAREGKDQVLAEYRRGAKKYQSGGDSRLDTLQIAASDDVGFWVGFQRGTAKLRGAVNPISVNLRITEVFRREGGKWKLVHRHDDYLATELPI